MRTMGPGELPSTYGERMRGIPHQVHRVADALRNGGRWETMVFIVGGAVRDFLYELFHGDRAKVLNGDYKFTGDYDMTTNLTEEEILVKLREPYAVERGIRVHEKASVDTFGVVFVHCDGMDIEVAPFRKDVGSSDGRHPDKVEKGLIYDDAARRDLTINSLYYDLSKDCVLDFNVDDDGMHGAGIEDVKNKTVRTVGDPFERFEEDKLRVLRMVRFFCRYNETVITARLDRRTRDAVKKYRNLHECRGMSPERIQAEFLSGLEQCLRTDGYLASLEALGLFGAIFPGLYMSGYLSELGTLKNPRVVLAVLLHTNDKLKDKMNELKYPNELSYPAQFLADCINFRSHDPVDLVRRRDRGVITGRDLTEEEAVRNKAITDQTKGDLMDMIRHVGMGDKELRRVLHHLTFYQPVVPSGEQLMATGLKGKEIGEEQKRCLRAHYKESWETKTF